MGAKVPQLIAKARRLAVLLMSNVRLNMKIGCHCGSVIPDQTDYLSFKAHLVADRDWEDFTVSSELSGEIDSSYVRSCYQCTECGRLYVEDASRKLHSFVPERSQTAVLGSCKGSAWRAPLVGSWDDEKSQGYLWCDADDGIYNDYDNWNHLESAYYSLFEKLLNLNRLRSAFLRKNGQNIHLWLPKPDPSFKKDA